MCTGSKNIHTLSLFHCQLAPVIAKEVSPKEEGELGVIFLLLHGHLLKLWAVPCHTLGQLVNDISQFLISRQTGAQTPV